MTFVVAEVSSNHNGSIEMALDIVVSAALAGANGIKFQTFIPEKMAIPGYKIKSGAWKGEDLLSLYRKAYTPVEWLPKLFSYAKELGLTPFSSPFDVESIEVLEKLNCPIYKIASFEIIDLRLIKAAASTGKPLIMSTGMASTHEIRAAVSVARQAGCKDITLLHCVSAYPTRINEVNLKTMSALKRFGCEVGLSDHTQGTAVAVAATALGAKVIEKHLTLSRNDVGLDSGFSMEPHELGKLVNECRDVEMAMGSIKFGQGEESPLRRSLYYTQDIEKGTILEDHHIKTARPALGLSPLRLNQIIGKPLSVSVRENDPVA